MKIGFDEWHYCNIESVETSPQIKHCGEVLTTLKSIRVVFNYIHYFKDGYCSYCKCYSYVHSSYYNILKEAMENKRRIWLNCWEDPAGQYYFFNEDVYRYYYCHRPRWTVDRSLLKG